MPFTEILKVWIIVFLLFSSKLIITKNLFLGKFKHRLLIQLILFFTLVIRESKDHYQNYKLNQY